MPERNDALNRLLVDCLHADTSRLDSARIERLVDGDWEGLLALARQQRVRPQLHQRLTSPDVCAQVPAHVRDTLRAACSKIAQRNLQLHASAVRLIEAFDTAGIRVVLLKGLHLAKAVYGNVANREIGDIDVLVPRDEMARATALLVAEGYAPIETTGTFDYDEVHHHGVPLVHPAGVAVELHWNVTQSGFPYSIDPAALWERVEPLELFGRRGFVLPIDLLLLHLCIHMGLQHQFEFGLRPLCDIAAVIGAHGQALDWPGLRRQADEWGWTRSVSLPLRLARDVVGVEMPADAAGAFELDRLPRDVVAAAIEASLALSDDTAVFSRRMMKLDSLGPIAKVRRLAGALARVPGEILRPRDGGPRDYQQMLRLVVDRDDNLRSTLDRQRRLEQFLSAGPRAGVQ